jgi:hypothetical protein
MGFEVRAGTQASSGCVNRIRALFQGNTYKPNIKKILNMLCQALISASNLQDSNPYSVPIAYYGLVLEHQECTKLIAL